MTFTIAHEGESLLGIKEENWKREKTNSGKHQLVDEQMSAESEHFLEIVKAKKEGDEVKSSKIILQRLGQVVEFAVGVVGV